MVRLVYTGDRKLRLIMDSHRRVPKNFREVEYLESNGTQYIDTGYKAIPATTKFELYFEPTNVSDNSFVFGARPDTSICASTMTSYKAVNKMRQDCAGVSTYFTTTLSLNQKYLFTAYNKTVSLNTESYTGTIERSTTRSNYNFALFTVNTAGTFDSRIFNGKIYYAKLWDNGVLVRDFIPCLDNNNVPCMWDRVEQKAYYNQGTGTFSYGHTITPVKYLESSGTQYIDTGYKPNNASGLYIDAQKTAVGNVILIGCRNNSTTDSRWWINPSGISHNICWNDIYRIIDFDMDRHTYQMNYYNSKKRIIDNIVGDDITETLNPSSFSVSATLFCANNNTGVSNFASAKIYTAKITEGSTLVRDYIPVKDENNVGYMFDTVSHTLYANAGTGSFVVGDEYKDITRFLKGA